MPSEAGVVEIDHANPIAVDQDILRHEVGVNETVMVRCRAQRLEILAHHCTRMHQKSSLRVGQRCEFPEPTPERLLADQSSPVPCVASKPRRTPPARGVIVHARRDHADLKILAPHGRRPPPAPPRDGDGSAPPPPTPLSMEPSWHPSIHSNTSICRAASVPGIATTSKSRARRERIARGT